MSLEGAFEGGKQQTMMHHTGQAVLCTVPQWQCHDTLIKLFGNKKTVHITAQVLHYIHEPA